MLQLRDRNRDGSISVCAQRAQAVRQAIVETLEDRRFLTVAAPTDLSVVVEYNNETLLRWSIDSQYNTDTAHVELDTGSGFSEIGTSVASAGMGWGYLVSSTPLASGVNYIFRVRLEVNSEYSDYSNTAELDLRDPPNIPDTVSDLSVVSDQDGVHLLWSVASDHEGDSVQIQWSTDSAGFSDYGTSIGSAGSGSGVGIDGITSGHHYEFRIKLTNDDGSSDWSNVAELYT